jgi:hypothetical protein
LTNLHDFRVVDVEGLVRPVAPDLKDKDTRNELIDAFWADAS